MSRPSSRATSRPPSRPPSRPGSRGASISSRRTPGPDLSVTIKDCESLIRHGVVGLPGGLTKSANPIILFPNTYKFNEVLETDLQLLLKYYVSIIPRNDQSPGFALVIDRSSDSWQVIQQVFTKIISVFPATIKEVFLVYKYPAGGAMLGQLVDSDYLLDFDIFHVSHVTELLHYIDAKYLSSELGGTNNLQVDTWLDIQKNVDIFTVNATHTARKLSAFMRLLHQEDKNPEFPEVAERNRNYYQQLRLELEEVTRQGVIMLDRLEGHQAASNSSAIQRVAVERLCCQLESTWHYFTNTFKIQDQLYVQNVELARFCAQFRDIAVKFAENEKIIRSLQVMGSNLYEVGERLDKFDNIMEAFTEDIEAAVALSKVGSDLILEHEFARDSLEPKCTQLRIMCKTQEILFLERRQTLLKFLDLFEGLDSLSKWCSTTTQHLNMDLDMDRDTDILSQIRQIDYLLSKARGMKIKSRIDFEEDFDDIKHLITAKTLFSVGDKIKQFEEVKRDLGGRRSTLRDKAAQNPKFQFGCDNIDDLGARREKVLEELVSTEENYVEDLHCVLFGYRDRLDECEESIRQKSQDIFGNLEEIYDLHSQCLLPELERCGEDTRRLAKTFLEYSEDIKRIYCRYCGNMETARLSVEQLMEEDTILQNFQRQLGHQLPLSSYLLKPVQRLTKYQLLLKDLVHSSPNGTAKFTLEQSLEAVLGVIKAVNDSLHIPNIKSLPEELQPLGSLLWQETVTVWSENKSQSQLLFRNKSQRRQVLLYENHLIFCKQIGEKTGETVYQFKLSLPITNMGMSSLIKGEERKMEIWIIGQPEAFTLEAKSKKAKDDFASELRKVIAKEKGGKERLSRIVRNVASSETLSATSGSESSRCGPGRGGKQFSRARSLDQENWSLTYQSGLERSTSEEHLIDTVRYRALADYTALTNRELNLHQGELVELVKVGCAGWWYVRLLSYPFSEGWAPSTYLEKLSNNKAKNNKNRNRTLDRF